MLKRKITSTLLSILVVTLLFTGCGMSKTETAASYRPQASESASPSYMDSSTEYAPAPEATAAPTQPSFNNEEYSKIDERGYASPLSEPLSTFSIDVDTASYSNMRRLVMNNQEVPQDAVRIEEMVNYFDYNYPEPKDGQPFAVYTEMSDCPWNPENKLLLIGLQAKEIENKELPPSNLVFLLDVSGSMGDANKLPLVKEAFSRLVESLRPCDRISIVTYAGSDRIVIQGASGQDKTGIINAINSLEAGGTTAGARGIQTAYNLAREYFVKDGNNRVILATDGDFNVGISDEEGLKDLIEEERLYGIYLSVLGFGAENIKDNKMETLADNGNGNYAYIDSVLEAKKVLVDQMAGTLVTVANDVKIQVEFNPVKVKGYRLVGYENRVLDTQDFKNDTKDAGEMGAGHRVTALYEIMPADSELTTSKTELKYQKDDSSVMNEWLTIKIRYKEPGQDKSIPVTVVVGPNQERIGMSEDFAFASSVAEFGLILRNSEYKGIASLEDIYSRISDLPSVQVDIYKAEFLNMIKQMMY